MFSNMNIGLHGLFCLFLSEKCNTKICLDEEMSRLFVLSVYFWVILGLYRCYYH